jgi:hypothetical protein
MKYKTLFRIICKAIGVYFFVLGITGVLNMASSLVVGFLINSGPGVRSYAYSGVGAIGALFEIAAGCYLFFDGRLLADWAIPGNRPYCPECGYDLSAAVSGICPECGTPTGANAE